MKRGFYRVGGVVRPLSNETPLRDRDPTIFVGPYIYRYSFPVNMVLLQSTTAQDGGGVGVDSRDKNKTNLKSSVVFVGPNSEVRRDLDTHVPLPNTTGQGGWYRVGETKSES